MHLSKSILVSCGLLCLGSSALAQPIPWQDQIAAYDLNTFGIHLPYFRSGTTFYDVHLDHLSNGPYTATLGNYGLSAPGTPDPDYYAVLSGAVLYVPVLEVGDLYYQAYFAVIDYSPYTFQLSTLVQIDEPEPDPPASACGFVPQADPKLAGLMSRMQGKLSTTLSVQGKPSGAILAVVKDGQLISAEGLGTRSKATYGKDNQPVNRETRFWVASTSKFMTAVGAMTLVDDGLLNLMAPVTSYLTSFTVQSGLQNMITMDNLLKMKAGLANDGGCNLLSISSSLEPAGCASIASSPSDDRALEDLFSPQTLSLAPWTSFNNTVQGTPGTAPWYYSNWGFMLVGRVMEVVSGKRHHQLMQDNVFGPANMCLATYDPYAVIAADNYAIGSGPESVDGYCAEPELGNDSYAPWMPDELACPARRPNGGVWASAIDLGYFAETLIDDLNGANKVLSQSAANLLLQPATGRASTGGSTWGDTYGYGNFHHTYNGYNIYTHGGGRAGFGTLFWIIPSRNFAIAVSNNIGSTSYFNAELEYAVRCYLDNLCN